MTTDTTLLDDLGSRDYADAWDDLEDVSTEFASIRPKKDRQLNLRVDEELLSQLREVAAARGEAYHSLARQLIEEGLARAGYRQAEAAPQHSSSRPFRMKEVLLVLLGAPDAHVENAIVLGKTRLQKLLFLVAQHMKPNVTSRFEAYDYGPFDEFVEPDIEFLASEGLIEDASREVLRRDVAAGGPTGAELLEWVKTRNEPPESQLERYRLTQVGMEWVRRFLSSDAFGDPHSKKALFDECARLKSRFGHAPVDELVAYVYAEFPEYASRSKIRRQVAERSDARATKRG